MANQGNRRSSRGKSLPSYRLEDVNDFITKPSTKRPRRVPKPQDDEEEELIEVDEAEEDEDAFQPDPQEEEGEADEFIQDEDEIENESVNDSDDSDDHMTPKCLGRTISTAAASVLTPRRKPKRPPRPPPRESSQNFSPQGKREPFPTAVKTKVKNTGITRIHHARGIDEEQRGTRGGGQESRLKDLFGPSPEDLKPAIQTKEWWQLQEALPSRTEGSLKRSFFVKEEVWQREVQSAREWYSGAGKEAFRLGQEHHILEKEQGAQYLQNNGQDTLRVIMGPVAERKIFNLNKGSLVSIAEPFEEKEGRRGWMLFLGSRIRDVQWAPNEEGGRQFLAVAVEQVPINDRQLKLENLQAPAFSASPQFPASIQIWAFHASEAGELDAEKPPNLDLVICAKWGAPKHMRWCPIAPADSVESSDDENTDINLGLLAVIWSDGKLRILNVRYSRQSENDHEPRYICYTKAAFEAHLAYTVPTCLHWLSGTTLAVGTAAGTMAIWTFTRPNTFPSINAQQERQYNPQPWFYRQVADTYIITLASGFPSRSTYISITTADGFGKLIDIRDDRLDTALTSRGRIFCNVQAWHEHTQSFLMPDEAYVLRSNTIRRYYANIHCMRLDSQISCCATSPVQPGVLLGGADGTVFASNALTRILNPKDVPWVQRWFSHEWRRPISQIQSKPSSLKLDSNGHASERGPTLTTASTETPNKEERLEPSSSPHGNPQVSQDVLDQPLVRISEGYKLEQRYPQPHRVGDPNDPLLPKEAIKSLTVYEEPTCVTALAWNPNLKFGTWAAAGLGSGLLRVEDLGV